MKGNGMRLLQTGRALGRMLAVCVLGLAAGTLAVKAEDDALNQLATALAAGVAEHFSAETCAAPPSLGIWPFDKTQTPLGETAVDGLYDELVAALVARAPPCVSIMDGAGIGAVLGYLHRTGALAEAGGNPVVALEAANRAVDIVVLPKLSVQAGKVLLSLKAVQRDSGETLVQTEALALPASRTDVFLSDTARDVETSVSAAVRYLADQAHDMSRLVPAGVFYQDTGTQPDFARYFQERIVAGLVDAMSNVISGHALSVLKPEFDLSADLGEKLSPRDLDPLSRIAERDGAQGLYQLRGTYWVLGEVVDMTVTLQAADGRTHIWQGRLNARELGGMALQPGNAAVDQEANDGSFAMIMTSPRGENPVYHPGEELTVYFRTDRRAWLYCFYIDSSGEVIEVLPNAFQKDFAQGHMLSPFVLHALPDPRRDPFTFRIDESSLGEERLKCLATSRNVTDDLPTVLQGLGFDAIPAATAVEIDEIFDAIPNVELARASVTVTIAPAP